MRKVVIISILFLMMWALGKLGTMPGAGHMVLVSIGFVILAAFTISELGKNLKLPQVTGYILAGIGLGPFVLNILSADVVDEMQMFNDLAIGLIALGAGLELDFASLKKTAKAIFYTISFKIVFLFLFVGGAFFAIESGFGFFGIASTSSIIALALVFSALALGTSPAIALAVQSESKAQGRATDLVMGNAIVKDIVVVVVLAMSLAVAKSLGNPEAGFDLQSIQHLFVELGLSVGAGLILGTVFIAYMRFIKKEMLLFIGATILLSSDLIAELHLEQLLVFIVAGVAVRNFSKFSDTLHHPLEKAALPVFVVFFTTVGAKINLISTWQVLPFAGALFAARAIAFYFSGFFAGKVVGELPRLSKTIWLGYLPQAGVTLALMALAAKQLPEHAELIANLGMGVVALNLLLGPLGLGLALKLNGEIPDSDVAGDVTEEDVLISEPEVVLTEVNEEDSEFKEISEKYAAQITDSTVRVQFLEVSDQLFKILKKRQLNPQSSILEAFVEDVASQNFTNGHKETMIQTIDGHFIRLEARGQSIHDCEEQFFRATEGAPVAFYVPFADGYLNIHASDGFFIVLKKVAGKFARLFGRSKERREIPIRKLVSYYLNPFLADFTRQSLEAWYNLLAVHIESVKSNTAGDSGKEQLMLDLSSENIRWRQNRFVDFCLQYQRTLPKLIESLNRVNTVYLDAATIRYSNVEPKIAELQTESKRIQANLLKKTSLARNGLRAIVHISLLENSTTNLIKEKFLQPLRESKENSDLLVKDVDAFFIGIEQQLSLITTDKEMFARVQTEISDFSKKNIQAKRKARYIRGSFHLLNRDISLNLKENMPVEEEILSIPAGGIDQLLDSSEEVSINKVNLRELYEHNILTNFLPLVEEKLEGVSNYLESLVLDLDQAFSILKFSIESSLNKNENINLADEVASIKAVISSEREKMVRLHEDLSLYLDKAEKEALEMLAESTDEVKKGLYTTNKVQVARGKIRAKALNLWQVTASKVDVVKNKLNIFAKNGMRSLNFLEDHPLNKEIIKRVKNQTLDAFSIKQYVEEFYVSPERIKDLPTVYHRLFNLDPIQDKRFFVAHKDTLKRRWRDWVEGKAKGNKVLIVGDRGMGKSSFLNVLQMDVGTEKIIRIEESSQGDLLEQIYRALRIGNKRTSTLLQALGETRTTVIIDDLDKWISRRNFKPVEDFLQVLLQDTSSTNWIISITSCNYRMLSDLVKIKNFFTEVVPLKKITRSEVEDVLLTRHKFSGLDIQYPTTMFLDWLQKIGADKDKEVFFNLLFEQSKGNLQNLIFLWLKALNSCDGRTLGFVADSLFNDGFSFLSSLSISQKFILADIYRFHSRTKSELIRDLGFSEDVVMRDLQFLQGAQVVNSFGFYNTSIEIPKAYIGPMGRVLKEEGLI